MELARSFRLSIHCVVLLKLMLQSTVVLAQLQNVALNKTTSQSSTLNGNPSFAVDGIRVDMYTYTNYELSPWWMVDLGQTFQVDHITIYFYSPDYYPNWNVSLSTSVDGITFSDKCYQPGQMPDGSNGVPYVCDTRTNSAHWIKVTAQNGYISLIEVEVLAEKQPPKVPGAFQLFESTEATKGTGSILLSKPVKSEIQCAYYCTRTSGCSSFNVLDNSDGLECQLWESVLEDSASDNHTAFWKLN